MTLLPGISGSLFPSRFLSIAFAPGVIAGTDVGAMEARRRHFLGWWARAERSCGPATGLRALFDLVAMPLAGLLGFRAHDGTFLPGAVHARLTTRRGGELRLVLLPWASRPSRAWRGLTATLDTSSPAWCLLIAPPFVSLVHARGHTLRRSLDFELPHALDSRSFGAFWTLCRAESFRRPAGIDDLVTRATRFQDAVREDLQVGVVDALAALGPVMRGQRARESEARFSEALTLVYRMLFLLFAESRDLVPRHHPAYGPAYAVGSLCREAAESHGVASGLWDGLAAVTRLSRAGCDTSDLIVRPFNGRLFARASAPSLESGPPLRRPTRASRHRDAALARALVALGSRSGPGGREEITYADLGVEQLGAVYERVLDLDPEALLEHAAQTTARRSREARATHGGRRKETGTFYTPQPLADLVIRRTIAPLVRGASADDILSLRVVDPAMGSGAFLVAACRYMAQAYERALLDEGRCAETDLDAHERANIRRLIAGRCLSGVDANPVAVQLARLSLWLTTLAKDKPLTFLDHQLRVGNSLIGTSPADLWRTPSVPSGARGTTPMPLFDEGDLDSAMRSVAAPWRQLREGREDTVEDVRAHERLWARISGAQSPLDAWRAACDLWCARWFWHAVPGAGPPPSAPELRAAFDALLRRDRTLDAGRVRDWTTAAREIARRHTFFHWPLEFADIFFGAHGAPRPRPGFDVVIGNPPWEMLRKDGGDSRADDPSSLTAFIRQSGLYPACNRGHVNLYQPFLERALSLARPGGRVGLVLPWGLAVDHGAAELRAHLLQRTAIDSFVGLDNAEGLFPIHRGLRFLVLVTSPGGTRRDIRARFGVRRADELDEVPDDDETGAASYFPVRLSPEAVRAIGGSTLRIPDLRGPDDLPWLQAIAARYPRLGSREGWAVEFGRELNATEDRRHFGSSGLPVIEGKHITPFRADPSGAGRWIREDAVARLLPQRPFARARLGYRDVSGAGNRRTLIAAIVPAGVVTTHTLFCLRSAIPIEQQHFLCGLFNSSPLNAIVRMLMGSHVTTSLVEDLPVPVWTGSPDQRRIAELTARLSSGDFPVDSSECQAAREELDRRVEALYSRLFTQSN